MAGLISRAGVLFAALAAATTLVACGGGGGGGTSIGTSTIPSTPATNPPPPRSQTASTTTGIAYIPGNGLGHTDPYAMTVVQYEDTTGAVMATPVVNEYGAGLLANQIISDPGGTAAVAIVGGSSNLQADAVEALSLNGTPAGLGSTANVQSLVGSPISIALMPDNDTLLVQGSTTESFGVLTGAKTGNFVSQGTFSYPQGLNPSVIALAVSPDGKTLIARGQSQTFVYAITASNGQYTLTQTANDSVLNGSIKGRGALAFDPVDSSKALFGYLAYGDQVMLETGLPSSPANGASIRLSGNTVNSLAFTPDGNYAVVGTKGGIYVLTGMGAGSLATVAQSTGTAYSMPFVDPTGSPQTTANVLSVGVSYDGKYVSAIATYNDATNQQHEALLVAPITNGVIGNGTIAVLDLKTFGAVLGTDDVLFR